MTKKSFLLKQYKISSSLGAVRSVASGSQFYASVIQFALIAAMAYSGPIGDQIKVWAPWISFPVYLVVFTIGFLILMLFEWKVMMPSLVTLSNEQAYKHNSPVQKDFEAVMKELAEQKIQIQTLTRLVMRLTAEK